MYKVKRTNINKTNQPLVLFFPLCLPSQLVAMISIAFFVFGKLEFPMDSSLIQKRPHVWVTN